MHKIPHIRNLFMLLGIALSGLLPLHAQTETPAATVPVHMTVTLDALGGNKSIPEVNRDDVIVKQGENPLKVTDWTPARGEHAGLDLFILIDDASDLKLGLQLDDLRAFINAQPPTTLVGVGYMRNGTVQIAQDFTIYHNQAAKALRLPNASSSVYGNPYLSLIDLLNRWPKDSSRREVIMVSDGIDRFRGAMDSRGLMFISPDMESASGIAQRSGTIIDTIFTPGVGRLVRNYWAINNGLNSMAKLSEETGGDSFNFGPHSAVSFKPYLDALQKELDNQYILQFQAIPGAKPGLQHVYLSTKVADVELESANSVWVQAKHP